MSLGDKSDAMKQMDKAMQGLQLIVEQYPQLRASENFKELQVSIMDTEEHLQASRRIYNTVVSKYNQTIIAYPDNFVAENLKLVKRDFFEAEQAKKQDVKMDF